MREWVAIQQLFSPGRTCLNYPNEAEWLWLSWKGMGGREPSKAIQERQGEQEPRRVCVCVRGARTIWMPCEVKWSVPGSQWASVSWQTDNSDLPLCASLFHLCCRGRAVNPSLPWTLAFTKPIHIFNKGQALRMQTSQWVGLHLFLPCLVK